MEKLIKDDNVKTKTIIDLTKVAADLTLEVKSWRYKSAYNSEIGDNPVPYNNTALAPLTIQYFLDNFNCYQ